MHYTDLIPSRVSIVFMSGMLLGASAMELYRTYYPSQSSLTTTQTNTRETQSNNNCCRQDNDVDDAVKI